MSVARIRSIKPEYFQHEGIYEAERESGLPLRLAYVGLWTQADRRGYFRWKPRELKLNILPFDEVDFGAVLDALVKCKFVEKWEQGGYWFGTVPALVRHQIFNVKERPNPMIPDRAVSVPTPCSNGAESSQVVDSQQHRASTVQAPVGLGMDMGIGKGKEGNGMERKGCGETKPGVAPVGRAAKGPPPGAPGGRAEQKVLREATRPDPEADPEGYRRYIEANRASLSRLTGGSS